MSLAEIGGTAFFFVMIVALIVVVVYFMLRMTRGRRISMPIFPTTSHVQLYFEEHFPDMISEWNLITRPKLDTWFSNMAARLDKVEKDISTVKSSREVLDSRLDRLDARLTTMESV
jgi:hypothetical protein